MVQFRRYIGGFLLTAVIIAWPAMPQDAADARLTHWTFGEPAPENVFQSEPANPAWTATAEQPVLRRRGVFGTALELRNAHRVQAPGFPMDTLPALTVAAWVRPAKLDGFREIVRQEGAHRFLFSFQEGGSVLSLGLDVTGYMECDARLDPAQALDGRWHFCAGTFDGTTMRVYWDGQEIGHLDRPGAIALSPGTPLFIGSMNGTSEHFQGGLDELRIGARAWSAQEIGDALAKGSAALEETAQALAQTVDRVYRPASSFAETLAATRRAIAENHETVDADLADSIATRLRTAFPDDSSAFFSWAHCTPIDSLAMDDTFNAKQLQRMVALMSEYEPLTEQQRCRQTPEAATRSQECARIRQAFEQLQARGEAARFDAAWYSLMLEAGRHIAFRPYLNEPVAPYVTPDTPATRDRTPAEAREALERDWMFQADNDPCPARIREEIRWAREAATHLNGDLSAPLATLDALEARAARCTAPDRDLYLAVRTVKRALLFKNPALDFTKVLFVDMPYPQGSEWQHETRHRLGYMAVPGARLLVLDGLEPGGRLSQLMPQAPLHGAFWRPDLSYDAKKVLFCFKPHNEKAFHLYEINADGSGLAQLTDGIYDDLDPVYLPDGHIMFATTRGHNYVRCMPPTNSFELARCDADGKNVYLISYSNEPDYLPSVMDDGRVVYTRWEYTDKPLWRAQKLWTTHPDGTQVVTLWGNQSVWPDVMKDARSIPGTRKVMFTGSAHHNWFAGSVGIIDPDQGLNFPKGLTKVTADVEWPECGNGPVDPIESPRYHPEGRYTAYYSPYPISARDFLVSAQRDNKFCLYLMDIDGNRELIYEGVHNILHAIPFKPRVKPAVLADTVQWPTREERDHPAPGVLFSNNVYQNAPEELRGKARYLRVLQTDPKTYTYWYKRPYISTGPVVSAVQSEGVKRILGTVPIAEDGSVSFYAPPGQALHFQLLDGQFRALQTMRSFVGVMPGESRGCLGCHESHSRTPGLDRPARATTTAPSAITPPPWPDATVSYARYVRPVLDQYCARCHEGDGEGRKTFDTTERPAPPTFSEPYLTLIGKPTWGAPYAPPEKPAPGFGIAGVLMVEAYGTLDPKAYVTPPPMTSLSYKSPLVELVSNGKHHGVVVDAISRQRLIAWIDAMCPYLGDEEVRAIPDPEFQGVDWLSIRPRIATAPVIPRPGPLD